MEIIDKRKSYPLDLKPLDVIDLGNGKGLAIVIVDVDNELSLISLEDGRMVNDDTLYSTSLDSLNEAVFAIYPHAVKVNSQLWVAN